MIAVEIMLLAFAAGAVSGGIIVYFWVRDWAEISWQAGKVEGARAVRHRLMEKSDRVAELLVAEAFQEDHPVRAIDLR